MIKNGFHRAAAIIVSMAALSNLSSYDVKNDADFFVGVGAALIGVLISWVVVSEVNS